MARPQEAAKQEIKKENPLPPSGSAGGQNHSDQNAKQELSSKVAGHQSNPEVLVNGSLTAQGAPADVDTTPSKFSARTAADDKQPIAAYRLKNLTDEQRKSIRGRDRRNSLDGRRLARSRRLCKSGRRDPDGLSHWNR